METKKIYCKIDENKFIQGYFICFAKDPKYKAMGCNFDESKDFGNAIVLDAIYLEQIHVGHSQIINGVFIENKPQEN